ncbi:MAG: ABC transporter ATP-binding protein, partial [Firmicutes bacterium]|nr:ABC transporter ATP-binding protein [Bacillota bacterium]
ELALPGYMSEIINKGIVMQHMDTIYHVGMIMIVVAFGSMAFSISGSFLASRVAAKTARDVRGALFHRVTSFSNAEMNQFSTASLITRSTNDVQTVQTTPVMVLRMAIFSPIMGVGALINAINTTVSLTWIIGVTLAGIIIIMGGLFFMVMPKFRVLQSKLDRLNLLIKERLSGILVVRAFNTEPFEEKRFDDANLDLTKLNISINRIMSFTFPVLMLIMNACSIMIVWFGSKMADHGDLMIGDMLALIQYAMHIILSFLFIAAMFIMIPRAAVSMRRIGAVLDVEPGIKDPEEPVEPAETKGVLEFRDVTFSFPDAKHTALEHVSFTASPGSTTAIIGGTGSGKTTLLNLIPRFYDVTEGEILLDGVDIRKMSLDSLRDKVGYVPQKAMLFSGTIASNLRFGDEEASEEDLKEAAEIAQAMEIINETPEGMERQVAQGGTNVSGGQQQRLSIARALVKKAPIYLFDDSFSALDFRTDRALRNALKEKIGDSTFIIVAQRINTIMDADQIIVLNSGRVAGIGTHHQLLEDCQVYKEIAQSQLSEEELRKEGI